MKTGNLSSTDWLLLTGKPLPVNHFSEHLPQKPPQNLALKTTKNVSNFVNTRCFFTPVILRLDRYLKQFLERPSYKTRQNTRI